jgi:hypothetical protein
MRCYFYFEIRLVTYTENTGAKVISGPLFNVPEPAAPLLVIVGGLAAIAIAKNRSARVSTLPDRISNR